MSTARTRATALTDTQGYSAKRIGMNAGRDPVKMAAHVWMALPTTTARVRKDFLVSVCEGIANKKKPLLPPYI